MDITQLKPDCSFFTGDKPCLPHKQHGVHCVDANNKVCQYYNPITKRVLIIKFGAVGDIIRTTPLIRRIKELDPNTEIWWITKTLEVLPDEVDVKLEFSVSSIVILGNMHFDTVYSLDKDRDACALAYQVSAVTKYGFMLRDGKCWPFKTSEGKYLSGVFDDISKSNAKSYQQELFEMCGLPFNQEKYLLPQFLNFSDRDKAFIQNGNNRKIVGLNVGCGNRWQSRLWKNDNWIELANKLYAAGYTPLLLGGPDEELSMNYIRKHSHAKFVGLFSLKQFLSLVNTCDIVVSSVTMAMHMAIGLEKRVIVFNTIFNNNEFDLYGLGEIVQPYPECTHYYSPDCKCMQNLDVGTVYSACMRQLNALRHI